MQWIGRGFHSAGRAMNVRLPNFLIVGAVKSGTTSMYHYLREHPQVFMPFVKEPAFLMSDGSEVGVVRSNEDYCNLFEPATTERAVGEASTGYLYDSEAPNIILDRLGDIKIIIILRNPIDAAYSLWRHRVREGGEELSFFEAMDAWHHRKDSVDFRRNSPGWIFDYNYAGRPMYTDQVRRYLATFSEVKVYVFEEVFADLKEHYRDLCRFLGISSKHVPSFAQHNRAGETRSRALRWLLNNRFILKEPFKKIMPMTLRVRLKGTLKKLNTRSIRGDGLTGEDRGRAADVFRSDVRALEQLLGRSLTDTWPDFAPPGRDVVDSAPR